MKPYIDKNNCPFIEKTRITVRFNLMSYLWGKDNISFTTRGEYRIIVAKTLGINYKIVFSRMIFLHENIH